MNKKLNSKLFYGLMISVAFSLAFGITYAYFKTEVKGNEMAKNIDVTTTTLALKYTDTLEVKAENITPGWSITKEVSVENIGETEAFYSLIFQNLINSIENNELVISAECTDENGNECESIEETPIMSTTGTKLYNIKDGILINPGEKHIYVVKLEFKELGVEQNYNQGQKLIGVLGIKESIKTYNVSLTFEDNEGNIIANAPVELHSTPKTGTTDNNGVVAFDEVSLGNHIITINTNGNIVTQKIKLLSGNSEVIASDSENIKIIKAKHDKTDLNLKVKVNNTEMNIEYNKGINELCKDLSLAECMTQKPEIFNLTSIDKTSTGNQDFDTIDYRFIGNSPNNYISFNDETWRILGAFEVYTPSPSGYIKEYRVKLVAETIGDHIYNGNTTGNINDWTTSTIMRMLNEGAYFNRSAAYSQLACSKGDSEKIETKAVCDFTNNGLTVSAKEMIDNTKWYLGTVDRTLTINEIYNDERSNVVLDGNKETWDGKIGLIYPSDYLYASTNYTNTTQKGNSTSWKTNNYLFLGHSAWTISPHTHKDEFKYGVNYAALGYLSRDVSSSDDFAIRPAVYLKSNIKVVSGNGTLSKPYQIQN